MTPIGHLGIALPVAHALRLELPVVFLCGLLPDLVDKPLWALGVGAPRYVAHTLLFLCLVTAALFLWKRAYGLAALLGLGSHLLLDWMGPGFPVPWLYPFASYPVPDHQYDPAHFLPNLSASIRQQSLAEIRHELTWVAVACVAAWVLSRFLSWYGRRHKRGA